MKLLEIFRKHAKMTMQMNWRCDWNANIKITIIIKICCTVKQTATFRFIATPSLPPPLESNHTGHLHTTIWYQNPKYDNQPLPIMDTYISIFSCSIIGYNTLRNEQFNSFRIFLIVVKVYPFTSIQTSIDEFELNKAHKLELIISSLINILKKIYKKFYLNIMN